MKLKKELIRITCLLMIIIIAVVTSSCQIDFLFVRDTKKTATDILADVVSAFNTVPHGDVYFSGAGKYDEGYLDTALADYIYFGGHQSNGSFGLISDYAVRIQDRLEIFEIHILKARSRSDVGTLRSMLESRLKILKEGSFEEYDYATYHEIIVKAEIFTHGKFAVMLITDDNEIAKKAFIKSVS